VDFTQFDPQKVTPARIIDLARRWRLPDGVPVVMLPGRLTRWKGQLVLIDALARLARPDMHCLLVGAGEGPFRRELAGAVARHGLSGRVQVLSDCRDMAAAYMLADVVVSASTDPEGFGRVIVEAQAMGRLVVATDHGGARETIVKGETGWLVPPGDAAALAAALNEVFALSSQERMDRGRRAIDHARTYFATATMTARTLQVYEELLFPNLS
ncbi:MAG TPA: glycosyltransferase, partial [Stellaceae bacterium]|nr:glycosyltransferase [Stellaceae bacterium]